MLDQHYPFTLPPLPCAYNALEPYIDTCLLYTSDAADEL